MNENEIERLFANYRDSLGDCGRPLREVDPKVPKTRWLVWSAGVGVFVAGTLAVTFVPTEASAAKLVQGMESAMARVRSMDMTFEAQRPSGHWVAFLRQRYQNGAWRIDSEKGRGQRVSYVLRNRLLLTDYERLDHATLEPAGNDFLKISTDDQSILDIVKQSVDSGHVDTPREMRVERRGTTDVIVMDRSKDRYHAEIVVDSRTRLPVSATVEVDYGIDHGGINCFRQSYRFGEAIPTSIFATPKGKPVLDSTHERLRLTQRWKNSIATAGETHVRDACVTSDGTVWIAVSHRSSKYTVELPASIPGYTRVNDVHPGSYSGNERPFELENEDLVFVGFAPIDPTVRYPTSVKVGFALRTGRGKGFAQPRNTTEISTGEPLSLALRRVSGRAPDWFPALDLDCLTLELPVQIWNARATALEDAGRDLEAAHAYECCAEAFENFIVYAGYRPLERAAACYDRLGIGEKATALRFQADALKAARER